MRTVPKEKNVWKRRCDACSVDGGSRGRKYKFERRSNSLGSSSEMCSEMELRPGKKTT